MKGAYEFLVYLNRLRVAHDRFKLAVSILNAILISVLFYAFFLLLGLPAFTGFYWQDNILLAHLPSIISVVFGIIGAMLLRRWDKSSLFELLGPELSEKSRTAYDNRNVKSVVMQSLAEDLKSRLSGIKPLKILKWNQIKVRMVLAVLLLVTAIFISQSQISADITPSDFRSIADLRDRALGLFQNETPSTGPRVNLSGNIYGKPSLAVLDEAKLELVLYPGVGAGSMSRVAEPLDRLFRQAAPGEALAVPSELYIESLPPQNKEIIKRYFENLAQSGE